MSKISIWCHLVTCLILVGCDRGGGASVSQSTPNITPPEAFTRKVYTRLDNGASLTLISSEECETDIGGDVTLGKYSLSGTKLRVVQRSFGTDIVNYYTLEQDGYREEKTRKLYADEQAVRVAANEKRQKLEQENLIKQQAAELLAKSQISTKTIAEFPVVRVSFGDRELVRNRLDPAQKIKATIKDAELLLEWIPDPRHTTCSIKYGSLFYARSSEWIDHHEAWLDVRWELAPGRSALADIYVSDFAKSKHYLKQLLEAVDAWKRKYPDVPQRDVIRD